MYLIYHSLYKLSEICLYFLLLPSQKPQYPPTVPSFQTNLNSMKENIYIYEPMQIINKLC